MPETLDPIELRRALDTLLASLPENKTVGPTTPQVAKKIRADIVAAVSRLTRLMREMDPIKHPIFVFDPTNPEIVGQLIGKTMLEQQRYRLATIPKFYGSGVYALYFKGDFDAYRPIKGRETPIYVGKADPPTPDAKTVEAQGPKLSARLAEHAKSVRAASGTLNIDDFECRFLVVQSGWQRAAEDYLVSLFKPIWNMRICYGFGKHGDDPGTRGNTRSPWDTLHPGRVWATREGNRPSSLTVEQIKEQIAEHFKKHPPKS